MNKNVLEGACVDNAITDLFDAYMLAARLKKVNSVAEARRLGAVIQQNLELGIDGLAPMGIHSQRRWDARRQAMSG